MYSLDALEQGLRDGSIAVDFNGHSTPARGNEHMWEEIHADFFNKVFWHISHTRKFVEESLAQASKKERSYLRREKDRLESVKAVVVGVPIFDVKYEHYCANCGRKCTLYLKDAHTVSFCSFGTTGADMSPCPVTEGPEPVSTVISVPSGELVIANYFEGVEDTPRGEEYDEKYDLDSYLGRKKRSKYLGRKGIGYGHMSGTSTIEVLLNRYADKIVINTLAAKYIKETAGYYQRKGIDLPDSLRKPWEELTRFVDDGFESRGSIPLKMWRWMCADRETLQNLGATPADGESIILQVKPGIWEIVHYYDSRTKGTITASEINFLREIIHE